MLSYENRLRKRKEFSYIYRKGEVYYSKLLSLYVVKTKNSKSKIGFSVSNKVGNSVVRHKVKRRLTEIVRPIVKTMPIKNYIFVARVGISDLTFEQLKEQVNTVVGKIKK